MANTAVETKDFPITHALSVVTGRLLSDDGIGCVYEVLNWMTGENLFTHQLPRVCREAQAMMIAVNPALAQVCEEVEQINETNWRNWLATWTERFGPMLTVHKLTPETHERIDALSELAEKFPPERISIIKV